MLNNLLINVKNVSWERVIGLWGKGRSLEPKEF